VRVNTGIRVWIIKIVRLVLNYNRFADKDETMCKTLRVKYLLMIMLI
jgi:hypothetical protein